ncbi:MAG: hypothetical protein QM675_08940, partial [Protaetiibacter sp.]
MAATEMTDPGATRAAPIDPLDRIRLLLDTWRARHPRLARVLAVSRLVAAGLSLLAFVVALFGAPELGWMLWSALVVLVPLLVLLLLTPTRTIAPRAVLRIVGVGAAWAPLVALISGLVVQLAGLSAWQDGASVGIAGLAEESLKLAPFAVFALLAPSRVRRMGAVDLLVIGWSLGAGFTLFEEGVRSLLYATGRGPGLIWAIVAGETAPVLTLNPLALNAITGSGTGHAVWSAMTMGALAVAIAVGRALPQLRRIALLLPLLALLFAATDHAFSNSGESWSTLVLGGAEHWWTIGPGLAWALLGEGRVLILALVLFWLWALGSDARRRHASPAPAESAATRATLARLVDARGTGIRILGGYLALVLQARD